MSPPSSDPPPDATAPTKSAKPASWVEPPPERTRRWALLASRLLRPERPQLAAARAVLDELGTVGAFDPSLAWETLAGRDLVPAAWAEPGARSLDPSGFVQRDGPSASMVLALAADPAGVRTAEELAREARRRAAPWLFVDEAGRGADAGEVPVEWRTIPRACTELWGPSLPVTDLSFELVRSLYELDDYAAGEDTLITRRVETAVRPFSGRSASKRGRDARTPTSAEDPPWRARLWSDNAPGQRLLYWLADAYRLELAQRRDVPFAQVGRTPESLVGLRYRDIEDPYEPLLGIVSLGYLLVELSIERVVLWAPEP